MTPVPFLRLPSLVCFVLDRCLAAATVIPALPAQRNLEERGKPEAPSWASGRSGAPAVAGLLIKRKALLVAYAHTREASRGSTHSHACAVLGVHRCIRSHEHMLTHEGLAGEGRDVHMRMLTPIAQARILISDAPQSARATRSRAHECSPTRTPAFMISTSALMNAHTLEPN